MGSKRKQAVSTPLPKPGDVFLMPLDDGRLGVCRVLRQNTAAEQREHGEPRLLVAASPWIGSQDPDLADPSVREIQKLTHHSWNSAPNMLWVSEPPPTSFQRIGLLRPTVAEERQVCMVSGGWHFAYQLLMQWRWDNDREAVLREDRDYAEKQAREYREAEKQRRQQRRALSLEQLLRQRRFGDWQGYVPDKALAASRATFRETIKALIALDRHSGEAAVLSILKQCVERLNQLDAEHEHFIESTVAEDVCEEIDLLAYASGLRGATSIADRWRDW